MAHCVHESLVFILFMLVQCSCDDFYRVCSICIEKNYFYACYLKPNRSDVTVHFIDENDKELGRDYFVAPFGQCTVTGYGNIKTITPRGGNNVYVVASCDLCWKNNGNANIGGGVNGAGSGSLSSAPTPVAGQVTDCF